MTIRRLSGQQGESSSTWAQQVVETSEDYTADGKDDLIVGIGNVTVTLPLAPYDGERHRVAASSTANVLVRGGTFPLANLPSVMVGPGTTRDFTFGSGKWFMTVDGTIVP